MEDEISYITSLIGDPVRTNILWNLLDNKAYTATELAICANTSAQNISMHLSKLVQADLLSVETQGRHKYYSFSKPEVAYAVEAISNLIPHEKHTNIISNKDNSPIKHCRTCYDHLAGRIGVLITESIVQQNLIEIKGPDFLVTRKGIIFFSKLEINTEELKKQRRIFAKRCLDWSERKHHLAGSLGAALLDKMLSLDWLRETRNSRAITITSKGRQQLYEKLKVAV
jgi:DNA-binding transcriptional ArsR family regulator